MQESTGMKPDLHLVNKLALLKWEKRKLNKVFQNPWEILAKDLLVVLVCLLFFTKYFASFF